MTATKAIRLSSQRLAIWVVCMVALGVSAISAFGVFQWMMRARRLDASAFMDLALPLTICVAALAMFEGARARRRWTLWPAIFLLLVIIPVIMNGLFDYERLTAANVTNAQDLTAPPDSSISATLNLSKVELHAIRGQVVLAMLCVQAIIEIPVLIIWHLRRKEVLQ